MANLFPFQNNRVFTLKEHSPKCPADFVKNEIDKFISDFKEQIMTYSSMSDVTLGGAYKAAADSLIIAGVDKEKIPSFNSIKSSLYRHKIGVENKMNAAVESEETIDVSDYLYISQISPE